MVVQLCMSKWDIVDDAENDEEDTSRYERFGVRIAWLSWEDLVSVLFHTRSGSVPLIWGMVTRLAHQIHLSHSFSWWFLLYPLISLFAVLNLTITPEQDVQSLLSSSASHAQEVTPSIACTDYNIHQVQYTPSTAYTKYSIHQVQHTPSTAYTKYNIHQVQHTPSIAYTKYRTHRVQHTLSTAYTEYCIHNTLQHPKINCVPLPVSLSSLQQAILYSILYIPTITSGGINSVSAPITLPSVTTPSRKTATKYSSNLRMSVNGASTIFSFASWIIYVPIGWRHRFIRYLLPLSAKTAVTCLLLYPQNKHQCSINGFKSCVLGTQGIAWMFTQITGLVTSLIVNNTIYQRKKIDSKLIDIANSKTFKNILLVVENTILIRYYKQTAKTRAWYESLDGPAVRPADNPHNSDGFGVYHRTVAVLTVQVDWHPKPSIW